MTSIQGRDHDGQGRHFLCTNCGDVVPAYYLVGRVCYSCHLDSYVPPGYEKAEKYRWDSVWGHHNATKRPSLGIPFLDQTGVRMELVLLTYKGRPQARGAISQR